MTDEILKLAVEYHASTLSHNGELYALHFGPEELEAFYRAAFNAGLEAAAKHMASRGDNLTSSAIRELKKK